MGLTVPGMGKQAIVDMIYPVGSIYMSTVKITPAAVFGGEWEAIRGKFLLAESDNHAAGSTGGEETHKLTVNEMPSHRHTQQGFYSCGGEGKACMSTEILSGDSPRSSSLLNAGGDQPHNNMPPYLAVYVWKRIA